MKKFSLLSLVLSLALLLAACGGAPQTNAPAEVFEGTSGEVLAEVLNGLNMEMMTFEDPITAENSQGYLGLTAEELAQYVEEATISVGALTVSAHQVAVVKCLSAEDAATVTTLISENFDEGRWVCVRPDGTYVVQAGSYVVMSSSNQDTLNAVEAFMTEKLA